jgi:hypothetical protein
MSSAAKAPTRPQGRPFKHGARALSKFVRENRLDRRTWLSKFIEQTEDTLAAAAGGHEALTTRERMVSTMAANLWVEWQLVQWQRQQAILAGTLVHVSDKYYLALVNALRRTMETLGLKPERTKDLPTLEQYLKTRGTNGNASHHDGNGAQGDDHGTGQPTAPPAAPASPTEAA